MFKEYGGYLAFELLEGQEYFYEYSEKCMLRLNSGRSAIYAALETLGATKVYTPFYLCESVLESYRCLNIPYSFYHIDKNFLPVDVALSPGEVLLWPHYFGTLPQAVLQEVVEQYGSRLIIDNTQAFFAPPLMNCCNVYSCRKFFGTPDGAYLIGQAVGSARSYPATCSHQRYHHLLESMELGTNAAYHGHLENEQFLKNELGAMSALTRRVLSSLDYETIRIKRNDNYLALHESLGKYNELPLAFPIDAPMVYPFLFEDSALRQALIERRIYIPRWWKHVNEYEEANHFEKQLSRFLLPLPIDQRYNRDDMRYISELIIQLMH